jgi:hypothetical protein
MTGNRAYRGEREIEGERIGEGEREWQQREKTARVII